MMYLLRFLYVISSFVLVYCLANAFVFLYVNVYASFFALSRW